jgi:hypothetical protein
MMDAVLKTAAVSEVQWQVNSRSSNHVAINPHFDADYYVHKLQTVSLHGNMSYVTHPEASQTNKVRNDEDDEINFAWFIYCPYRV